MAVTKSTHVDLLSVLQSDSDSLVRFLHDLGDALFVVDSDQTVVFWNRQAEALTGYRADEVIGQHCLKGIRCENCLYRCGLLEDETLEGVRVQLRTKDGGKLYVRKSVSVIRDPQGEIIGGVEWMRDETQLVAQISRCKSQREIIAEREQLQAAVLGSIREGVLTIDADWRITSFSRRAAELTGWPADEAMGKFCHQVIGSRLCQEDCPAQACLETGAEEAERTTEIKTRAGRPLPVAEIGVPLRDEGGRAIGSVLLIEDRTQLVDSHDPDKQGAVFVGMIGRSESMRRIFQLVEQVAPSDVTVLITGESGTGKELVARALHRLSKRAQGPLQAVNCAALPETLLESELFGHAKGAFTGALRDRSGRIEEAEGGTLFLDEIGEMPLSLQAKLLRFLQERDYQRVGESLSRKSDVRIVTATNKDLQKAVADGEFREDLYYRIRVIPVAMPPLRERADDIPVLAVHLLGEIAKARGRPALSLSQAALGRLVKHTWPGNVRELNNALEYAVALAPGRRIRPEDLPPELAGVRHTRYSSSGTDGQDEAVRIQEALVRHNNNRTQTARFLGMDRVTLYRKMKRYGIS